MGKNVAVFVDVANIFYAAKAAGVDIDYVTLLKTASAGRDLVRAYAYTGLDPDNENQRNFHDFLRRHGYKVVSKDIRKYGDGKVKANLDIELVVDMMKTARNLDIAIVISGDGDFAPAIRAVQEMGVRVEVISFRGNTSSDLIEVADQFTEITQIARVEKGSSRSGRRVATDDEDLSMTEVPDKQSEGTGARGRGRGRGRGRSEGEPAVAAAPRGRGRARSAVPAGEAVAAVTSDGTPLVVLPGEKLSRVAATPAAAIAADGDGIEEAEDVLGEPVELADGEAGGLASEGEEQRRRRRRRGGRGRGRGRGQGEEAVVVAGEPVAHDVDDEDEAVEPMPAPAKRAGFAFGSVWDSQIGMPVGAAPRSSGGAPIPEEDDLDEPPIPEYLISERRQRGQGGQGGRGPGGGGGRGRGGAYAAALDRERYGGGRGAGVNRFAEPAPRGRDDRPPRDDRPRRDDRRDDRHRGDRPAPRPQRTGSGDEPWSEVPPEIEAMLRAQLGARGPRPARPAAPAEPAVEATPVEAAAAGSAAAAEAPAARAPRRRTGRATSAASSDAVEAAAPAPAEAPSGAAPKRRTTRTGRTAAAAASADAPAEAEVAAPKRRTTRKAAATSDAPATEAAPEPAEAVAAAPKRRTTRKKADATES